MSDKTVTPEMIDDELVDEISYSADFSNYTNRDLIAGVLACLANRPIKPTQEQRDLLMEVYKDPQKSAIVSLGDVAVEFQRIAYLKKEPEYPEIEEILKSFSVMGEARKAIVAAYKIGKGESK